MIHYTIGDAREFIPTLPPESVDLLLTDPPYGINYRCNHSKDPEFQKRVHSGMLFDQSPEAALQILQEVLDLCVPILKPHADAYIFSRFNVYPKVVDLLPDELKFKNVLIWDKNAQSMGDLFGNWCYTHEFILYLKKGRRKLNKRSLSVLHYPFYGDFSNTIHPTKKPVALCEELILNSTNEDDLVLDPFVGSGTTLRACRNTKRAGIGYELDPQYADTIRHRVFHADLQKVK